MTPEETQLAIEVARLRLVDMKHRLGPLPFRVICEERIPMGKDGADALCALGLMEPLPGDMPYRIVTEEADVAATVAASPGLTRALYEELLGLAFRFEVSSTGGAPRLPDTRRPFTVTPSRIPFAAALLGVGLLQEVGGQLAWTDAAAPYMQASRHWVGLESRSDQHRLERVAITERLFAEMPFLLRRYFWEKIRRGGALKLSVQIWQHHYGGRWRYLPKRCRKFPDGFSGPAIAPRLVVRIIRHYDPDGPASIWRTK